MSVLGRFSTLLAIKKKINDNLERIKKQKLEEALKFEKISAELKEVIIDINPKSIIKILKKN